MQEQQEIIDQQASEIETLDERLNKVEALLNNSLKPVSTAQQ